LATFHFSAALSRVLSYILPRPKSFSTATTQAASLRGKELSKPGHVAQVSRVHFLSQPTNHCVGKTKAHCSSLGTGWGGLSFDFLDFYALAASYLCPATGIETAKPAHD